MIAKCYQTFSNNVILMILWFIIINLLYIIFLYLFYQMRVRSDDDDSEGRCNMCQGIEEITNGGHRMRTPGFVWVLMAASLFLPDLGWTEVSGAKAIFASGEGPTVVVETPDSAAPTHRIQQPAAPKTEAASQTEPQRERYIGFSYWVELLDGDGQHRRVTTDRLFRRGDRIRFNIASNWNTCTSMSFTSCSTGRSASTATSGMYTAAAFWQLPCMRHRRMPHPMLRCVGRGGHLGDAFPYTPVRDYAVTLTADADIVKRRHSAPGCVGFHVKGAKDLLLEVDNSSPQPASYVVAPLSRLENGGEIIAIQVKLKHE